MAKRKPKGLPAALDCAKRKYPKSEIRWRYDPAAPTLAETSAMSKLRIAEKESIKQELASIGRVDLKLIDAVRFALDVDGDEPSWTQLKEACAAAARRQELIER